MTSKDKDEIIEAIHGLDIRLSRLEEKVNTNGENIKCNRQAPLSGFLIPTAVLITVIELLLEIIKRFI